MFAICFRLKFRSRFVTLGGVLILSGPTLVVMISFLSTPDTYGTMLGLRTSVASLARALSPLVNGQLFDIELRVLDNPHYAPFILCAGLLLVSALLIRLADVSSATTTLENLAAGDREERPSSETDSLIDKKEKLIN